MDDVVNARRLVEFVFGDCQRVRLSRAQPRVLKERAHQVELSGRARQVELFGRARQCK